MGTRCRGDADGGTRTTAFLCPVGSATGVDVFQNVRPVRGGYEWRDEAVPVRPSARTQG
jgi:hypothetical protein